MSGNTKDINLSNKLLNNALINQSERNNTVASNIPKFSTFDKSFRHTTSFDSGFCIPILMQEVYPSDMYEIDTNTLIQMSAQSSTPWTNINYDINFFFVPWDQLDREFKQLMGENNSYGYSNTEIEFPKLLFNNDLKYTESDVGSYFGIPINTSFNGDWIQLYPFLAYGKIWNEWYRDQNLQDSIDISTVFNNTRSINSSSYSNDMSFYESIIFGKGLAPSSKLADYFTTCLPYQQKGQPVTINSLPLDSLRIDSLSIQNSTDAPLQPYLAYRGNGQPFTTSTALVTGYNSGQNLTYIDAYNTFSSVSNKSGPINYKLETSPTTGAISYTGSGNDAYTITDLRYSIVTQHLLENLALCGSRYIEQLQSIWGIRIDPKSINRTEHIGGINESLIYNNVMQTSQTTNQSQLGKIASNLYNSIGCPKISYAAEQHGYIIGIATCRTQINNGGQGLSKLFKRENMYDLFNPMFNGISEQPVYNYELFYKSGAVNENNETFGFNEPFVETKFNWDNATGFFSLRSNTSLFSQYLFGVKYDDTPILSSEWIKYDPNIIGNSLYNFGEETKEFYHQFIAQFTFQIKYTTKQPLFNSPRVYGI